MLQKYYYFLRTAKESLTFAMGARKKPCSNGNYSTIIMLLQSN